jgi:hypothetical protein
LPARALLGVAAALLLSLPASARAQEPAPARAHTQEEAPQAPELAPDAHIEINPEAPSDKTAPEAPGDAMPSAIAEAPPPRPRKKGLVLESNVGVLGFAGQFRHVAPPAYWLHAQLGYEVTDWLMLFGEGELAFTDSGQSLDESNAMAFSIFGFGGGARGTLHTSARVALFGQVELDALAANVPHNSLAILGYRNSESLAPSLGVRLGIEWYQMDRHLALAAQVGGRDATGFAKVGAGGDIALMWDASVAVRYTF